MAAETPAAAAPTTSSEAAEAEETEIATAVAAAPLPRTFAELGLDCRLQRALVKRGFSKPTPVQAECIPRTLEGKDVVARARTGSGKTLAYLLPAIHCVLMTEGEVKGSFKVIILVPTKELCEQVKSEASATAEHCGCDIKATTLLGEGSQQLKRAVAVAGQIVVSTPSKIAAALREGLLSPSVFSARLQMLVLDEADLLLSYGYEEDLQLIAPQIPRSCQCMLMSATMSADVEKLQKLVLHNPVALNLLNQSGSLEDDLASGSGASADISHYSYNCAREDKLLAVMAMLKLGLVRKKALIFVNTVDKGFQLKLFLESFGVRSALLNAELPLNSRSHILQTFNKGLFDFLIATDDVHAASHDQGATPKKAGGKGGRGKKGGIEEKGGRRKGPKKDEEFGVTRGIDFKGVRTIINLELPSSVQGYVHRAGRTGRAGEAGIAVTLLSPEDVAFRQELVAALKPSSKRAASEAQAAAEAAAEDDEEDGEGPSASGNAEEYGVLKPFSRLTRVQLDALRYRGEDIIRSITKNVIKEARAKELKLELLNSEKLKDYFEEHMAEKQLLRHDKPLHRKAPAAHLRHVPAYLKDAATVSERGKSHVPRGKGQLPDAKRRKLEASLDPLKAGGFVRAPKRGGGENEELTEGEKKAVKFGKAEAKKRAKMEVAYVPKVNVRKVTRRR